MTIDPESHFSRAVDAEPPRRKLLERSQWNIFEDAPSYLEKWQMGETIRWVLALERPDGRTSLGEFASEHEAMHGGMELYWSMLMNPPAKS